MTFRDGRQRVTVGASPSGVAAGLVALRSEADVASVVVDHRRRATMTPNDPCFSGGSACPAGPEWGLTAAGLPAAWDVTRGASNVKIAILDTGVTAIADLAGRVVDRGNWTSSPSAGCRAAGTGGAADDHGHGTSVAGVAAAAGYDGRGMAGAAWSVQVYAYKVLDCAGSGWDNDIAAALRDAADRGVQVANLSLAGPDDDPILRTAVTYANARGTLVVVAAGNDGTTTPQYPAAYPEALAVAATTTPSGDSSSGPTAGSTRASFSSYGSWIDIAAPGTLITVPSRTGTFNLGSGTSFASPIVAGVAALVATVQPGIGPDGWRNRILSTARGLCEPGLGSGLLQAGAAVGGASIGTGCSDPVGGWMLDGWGALHPIGNAPALHASAYWPGWDIARDVSTAGPLGAGAQVLDGWGGLHPASAEGSPLPATLSVSGYWRGWDIARAVAVRPDGQAYVLDGWGGIHPASSVGGPALAAPTLTAYWSGWDIARDIVVLPNAPSSGYVLDGWGGVHPFGGAPPVISTVYWLGWNAARQLILDPSGNGSGWVLDLFGALHPFAPEGVALPPGVPVAAFPVLGAIGATMTTAGVGEVASNTGVVHGAGANTLTPARWPGWSIARSFTGA